MFTNARDMCQIIYRNVQALKLKHTNFQNTFSRFVITTSIMSLKLTEHLI